ncbi:hypothetical protein GCM10010909_36600 [Acidocella aquatica]|uniref:Uncharacterized protein n=1 Tax=Acidocella aquatica TaxID=1922313 RepID=A0ABQ6ABN5_9PROT|nr:hypothetical protein GCM10010909_36600 [Acidocella aquatica]
MPVDDGWLAASVFKRDGETLTWGEPDAVEAVSAFKREHGGGFAVNFDDALGRAQTAYWHRKRRGGGQPRKRARAGARQQNMAPGKMSEHR